MDCTRSQRVLAHTATAGAFLVCFAVAGGLVGADRLPPRETAVASEPSQPTASQPTWTQPTWTTSAATTAEVALAAPTPAQVEPKEPAAPVKVDAAPAGAEAPIKVAARTESAPAAVADLPPPVVIGSLTRVATRLADMPAAEAESNVVGLWAPDASACSVRSFRQGLLPTVINTEGAWAGETFCIFKNRKSTEAGWRVVAECSSGGDHWTTQVRLSVKGGRLIWESRNGRQVYTRCGSDLRMAAAP